MPISRLPNKLRFQRALLAWFAAHGRDLPWRHTNDPYHILVSEMMLQQTQVERVAPKYTEWLDKYPTLEELAAADVEEVKATWKGLGYNVRPVRLHGIARETVAGYGGQLPASAETLRQFKGIGRYTAGAIASFAFRHDEPVLDTNVRRVLFRVFLAKPGLQSERRATPQPRSRDRELWEIAAKVLPKGRAWEFNSALMDFGATVCTARTPRCGECPMATFCADRRQRGRLPKRPVCVV
ncbi:MAG: putative A/G-specific adenine glycosylase YfhQ [bacterium ADurb.Bin429]|nr:MAG: putative A/G-specific adenine glycosylase YfhQ [bacterium ADurb.Bin429]